MHANEFNCCIQSNQMLIQVSIPLQNALQPSQTILHNFIQPTSQNLTFQQKQGIFSGLFKLWQSTDILLAPSQKVYASKYLTRQSSQNSSIFYFLTKKGNSAAVLI
ncbi:Hypothetical_protein [Hexamita inflata]|uniref:Hypothetical_protein n=1 Tax=Hexamita inflata TaxID=28002 RepID=A0AA86Q1C7_9EUKA|nr:Hypothetical protein HINF_LOCUS32530 [Hexamita inflata]